MKDDTLSALVMCFLSFLFYEVLSQLVIFCSVLSQTELSDAIAILVAGNDRTQALISQMEDICRTVKVRNVTVNHNNYDIV